ncbi:MAG: hypothetical protein KAS32_06530 [Candidatus Peribacteraceae bacterium]|nr:hypothetical protein [Candidatus Peribacteraceae bacterium]
MVKDLKDLVLCYTICLDDGWYGDRHRFILSVDTDIGFTTKTTAKKYASKLKKFLLNNDNYYKYRKLIVKLTTKEIGCSERSELVDYTHVSPGPSLSYTHHNITVEELEKYLSELEENKY